MSQSEQQPPPGMAHAIARLDAAMGPEFSSRAMGRALGASEASIRRWRRNWPLAEDQVLAMAAALGLDPAQVRGYAPLPEAWPPPGLLVRLGREKRAPGRRSQPPAAPAEGSPAGADDVATAAQLRLVLARLDGLAATLAEDRQMLRTLVTHLERIERALAPDGADGEAVKNGASYATGTAMPPTEPDA